MGLICLYVSIEILLDYFPDDWVPVGELSEENAVTCL